jgi:hypothetical protein
MQQYVDYARKFLFDPTVSTEFTPIPQLKLNYRVISDTDYSDMQMNPDKRTPGFYFMRAEHEYFRIRFDAKAKDNNLSDAELPIELVSKSAKFDLAKHSEIVKDHVKLYKEKSDALVKIAGYIVGSLLLALVAPTIPFIPFTGLVSYAAWAAACYFVTQCTNVYNEYHDALILLVATCNWALGSKKRTDYDNNLAKSPVINNQTKDSANDGMMDHLYKVLTKTQIKHLIADDIEKQYTDALEARDSRFKFPGVSGLFAQNPASREAIIVNHHLEQTAMKQHGAEITRCLFGLNRGTAADFVRVLSNAIPDFLRAGYNIGKDYFTKDADTSSSYSPV